MSWYATARSCFALRKHVLRVDMRVYSDQGDTITGNDQIATVKSILTAAIVKGLDVVGLVAPGSPQLGWQARQMAREQNLDIYVVPGEEYTASDKAHLVVYNLQESLTPNLTAEQAIAEAHGKGGLVMMFNMTKRQAAEFNKIKGTPSAPDAIEIYNESAGGYTDNAVQYLCFISSAARTATDMEKSVAFTLVSRPDFEKMGFMPEGQGSEYMPNYLQNADAISGGADPMAVANGLTSSQAAPNPNPPVPGV